MSPTPPLSDEQYTRASFRLSEAEHRYGARVHLLADPVLSTQLAKLCSEGTIQPEVNRLMTQLYTRAIHTVAAHALPLKIQTVRTRMTAAHPEGAFLAPLIDRETPAVSVNLARAGTLPSHICYSELNELLDPNRVRQDHISISRTTDSASHQVTGAAMAGHKIGGRIDGAAVFIPDPMGATGSTVSEVITLYKKHFGSARKFIAIHCIVTPEYLKRITTDHPDAEIYAFRLDRGLSPAEILKTIPGTHWDQERGLNASQYIVPGGGGLGEVLNNAFV